MGYIGYIPESLGVFEENLTKVQANKGHIKAIHTNESTSTVEFDLDWSAHKFGGKAGQDFYIPIKRGKLREAKEIVDKMMAGDHAPSHAMAKELYDMIDPQSR